MGHFGSNKIDINYNYPNMNFGEAIAYGALGSLTGMGGYGSCNSIYTMPGVMSSCGGYAPTNQQVGMYAAYMGLDTITKCVFSYISQRREDKEAKATAKENIKALEKDIKALETEQTALNIKIDETTTETQLSGVKKYFPTQVDTYRTAKATCDSFANGTDEYSAKIAAQETVKDEKGQITATAKKEIEELRSKRASAEVDAKRALKEAIRKLNSDISDRQAEITSELETKKTALNEANGTANTTNSGSSTQTASNNSLSEKINDYDGNAATRKLGLTKNSKVKTELAAFRKASDKLAQDPYALTEDELGLLSDDNVKTLCSKLEEADNTESAQSIISDLEKFYANNKTQLEKLNRIIKEKKPTIEDLNPPYFKKQNRMVNGKMETIYNGRNSGDEYIIQDGNVVKLNEVKKGTLFNKAQYSIQTNNDSTLSLNNLINQEENTNKNDIT